MIPEMIQGDHLMKSRIVSRYSLVISITLVLLLTGCELGHTIYFENHTQSTLLLTYPFRFKYDAEVVGPCSVAEGYWSGGPAPDEPALVEAFYPGTWDVAYSQKIVSRNLIYKVVLTEGGSDKCPPAITGSYQVIITNTSKLSLRVTRHNRVLSEIDPGEVLTFGPFKGAVGEAHYLEILPSSTDKDYSIWEHRTFSINYSLGQVPTARIVITN
jgi:hypothetical protein